MDWLKATGDILAILAALPATITAIAVTIPKVRAWLVREPWRAAAATSLVAATIASFALWALLLYAVASPPGLRGIPGSIAGRYSGRAELLVTSQWRNDVIANK